MARKSKHDKATATATGSEEEKKVKEDYSDRTNQGVVLTGGIDSTVLLYSLKENLPEDTNIIPIVLGNNKKDIQPVLDELEIKAPIQKFNIDIDPEDDDESKMLPLIEWALENKVYAIYFPANHDEQEHSIPGKTFDYFQRLNDLSGVSITAPFITVSKEKIIQDAVDRYNIDLSQLAEPPEFVEGIKISESLFKIRQEGFKKAFSVKENKWIQDPFAEEKEKDKDEEKGE